MVKLIMIYAIKKIEIKGDENGKNNYYKLREG